MSINNTIVILTSILTRLVGVCKTRNVLMGEYLGFIIISTPEEIFKRENYSCTKYKMLFAIFYDIFLLWVGFGLS